MWVSRRSKSTAKGGRKKIGNRSKDGRVGTTEDGIEISYNHTTAARTEREKGSVKATIYQECPKHDKNEMCKRKKEEIECGEIVARNAMGDNAGHV